MFIFQSYPVCNFGKNYNFGFGAVSLAVFPFLYGTLLHFQLLHIVKIRKISLYRQHILQVKERLKRIQKEPQFHHCRSVDLGLFQQHQWNNSEQEIAVMEMTINIDNREG